VTFPLDSPSRTPPQLGGSPVADVQDRRHGRRRNPARTSTRSSLRTPTNQPRHSTQRVVEKVGRSITNSETPQSMRTARSTRVRPVRPASPTTTPYGSRAWRPSSSQSLAGIKAPCSGSVADPRATHPAGMAASPLKQQQRPHAIPQMLGAKPSSGRTVPRDALGTGSGSLGGGRGRPAKFESRGRGELGLTDGCGDVRLH
jgi:hypothetical protein